MQVTAISNIEQFDNLKDNWDTVYSADHHATVFLSWAWLRGWIENISYDWLALAVQTDTASPYVAFMVVGLEPVGKTGHGFTYSLYMGGHPFADHTGFVCLPEYVEEAIPIFATFIKNKLKWNKFVLRSVFDPRLDIFLRRFSQKRFILQENEGTSCPYIPLPETWDQYLQKYLSSKARKNLEYQTRKLENLNGFRFTLTQADNIDSQIETLLTLWKFRWGLNSDDYFMGFKTEHVLNICRSVFHRCFENDHLSLQIIWDGDTPVAGQANFVDKQKQYFFMYKVAVNYKFAKLSPGRVMNGYQIRYAIENGFRIFDFGLGNEEYKYKLGAKERFTRNITIRQMSLTTMFRNHLRIRSRLRNIQRRLKCTIWSNVR